MERDNRRMLDGYYMQIHVCTRQYSPLDPPTLCCQTHLQPSLRKTNKKKKSKTSIEGGGVEVGEGGAGCVRGVERDNR